MPNLLRFERNARSRAALVVQLMAVTLLLAACNSTAPGTGGTTTDPESSGTFTAGFDGSTYTSSSDDSYGAAWTDSTTGELALWLFNDYTSYTSGDSGVWIYYLREEDGTETVLVYRYSASGSTVELYESTSVSAALTPVTTSTAYGVGIGSLTGTLSAVTEMISPTTGGVANLNVTDIDVVLYDYAAYSAP